MTKPTTHQRDLAKVPRALAPLIERPQWCVWLWTQKLDGKWQKPPYQARDPRRHASSTDPSTWSDYSTALAAVQAGHADGITYVLTADDPFAAIDLDHFATDTHSIEIWAQLFLSAAAAYLLRDAIRRPVFGSGASQRRRTESNSAGGDGKKI
jgi:hypothetical protein